MELNSHSSLLKAVVGPPRAQYEVANLGPREADVGVKVAGADIAVLNVFTTLGFKA